MRRYVIHVWTEEERKKLHEMFLGYATRCEMANALGVSLGVVDGEIEREQAKGNLPKRANGEAKRERSKRGITTPAKRPTMTSITITPIDEFVGRGYSLCWLCRRALPGSNLPYACRKPVEGFDADERARFDPSTGEFIGNSYFVRSCPNFEKEPWVDRYVDKHGSLTHEKNT